MNLIFQKNYLLLVVLLVVQLLLLINLRFTAWPEMLSYPYLKNHGYLLYRDMIHPYPPVLTLVLSTVFKITGYKIMTLQVITWGLALLNTIIIYFIGKSLKGKIALVAAAIYSLTQPFLEGNMLWFDFAISTPLLLAFLFATIWLKNKDDKYLFITSFMLTSAGLIKQTGGLFFIVFILWLSLQRVKLGQFLIALLTPAVLFVPLLIRLLQEQAVEGFIKWVVLYPTKYWSDYPGYVQMDLTKPQLLILLSLTIPIFFIKNRRKHILLFLFVILGLISLYPRFSYFHLQTALPFLVIGLSLFLMRRGKLVFLFAVLGSVVFIKYLYQPVLATEWQRPTRFYEKMELDLSDKIKSLSLENEKVFLLGLNSSLYVHADRLPPKPWVDNFGWYYEIEDVAEQTLTRWENNPPEHIFWRTPNQGNWYDLGVYQPKLIIQWIENNYEKVEPIADNVWYWKLKE